MTLTFSQMFEKQPDQLASLKVQMMDKTAYCTQRHIILLDDTAKNLKEGTYFESRPPTFSANHRYRELAIQYVPQLRGYSIPYSSNDFTHLFREAKAHYMRVSGRSMAFFGSMCSLGSLRHGRPGVGHLYTG